MGFHSTHAAMIASRRTPLDGRSTLLRWRLGGTLVRELLVGDPDTGFAAWSVELATPHGVWVRPALTADQLGSWYPVQGGENEAQVSMTAGLTDAARDESLLHAVTHALLGDESVIVRGERTQVDPATGRDPYYDRYEATRRIGPRSLARQRYWRCAGGRCDALDWATDESNDGVIGVARHGDRWGLVAIERIFSDDGATQRTRFEASDGVEAVARQLNLLVGGRWETSVRSPACPHERSPSEIHWVYGYDRRDATFAGIRDTRVMHTVHEVRPDGVCLRRVEGVEYGVRRATLWLEARGGVSAASGSRWPAWASSRSGSAGR